MPIMDFTVEEMNLIAMYKTTTAEGTLMNIAAAYLYMDDDILTVAEVAAKKLAVLTDAEFSALSFVPADETDEGVEHEKG